MTKTTFEHVDEQSDLATRTYENWPQWKYTIPFPSTVLMGSSGTPDLGIFLAVGSVWAQIVDHFMPDDANLLDIGCGCAKTARFLAPNPRVRGYVGFDPMQDCVDWANRFVRPHTSDRFRFLHVDLHSEEYNPHGVVRPETYRFPADDASVDTAIAASLFTHLLEPAATRYLHETGRVLRPGGCAIFSVHTEPRPGENFSGHEGRVDVRMDYFLDLARQARLELKEDLGSVCGQETIVLERR